MGGGSILKMQGWTQLLPCPRSLLLGMPPTLGLYPTTLTQHPQSISMCMFWVILVWKKLVHLFELEVGMCNHSQQAGGAVRTFRYLGYLQGGVLCPSTWTCDLFSWNTDSLWTIRQFASSGTMRFWGCHFPTHNPWAYMPASGMGAHGPHKGENTLSIGLLHLLLHHSRDLG